jgi:aryl-alcohol dehydrogenase-like predicted oxidoreductase
MAWHGHLYLSTQEKARMKFRTLGNSGLVVSEIGLGTDNFGYRDDIDVEGLVSAALDAGVNLFDTADVYGWGRAENALGKALGSRRKDVIIATKWGVPFGLPFGHTDGPNLHRRASRGYIMRAVERSLKHLGTDYIDLYELHFPDKFTPPEETMQALNDLIRQGKVRYLGVSNLPAWQVVELQLTSRLYGLTGLVSTQDEYSLLKRRVVEGELLDVLQRYKLGLLPYFPLASGMLTGKYKFNEPPAAATRFVVFPTMNEQFGTRRNYEVVHRLQSFATSRNHTILELAFSWLLACPAVSSVIAGATNPRQMEQNVAAGTWSLSPQELAEIDSITRSLPET